MLKSILMLVLFSVAFAQMAVAGRLLPQDVKTGMIRGVEYPQVNVDGTVYKLSPGSRVFDQSNRSILPGSIPQSARIFYQLNPQGELSKVWIMTPDEEVSSK
ncbi:hypothetical protein [Sulfurirhabdus autotrophica]|uniref:Nickel/cobalt transporter regulator n=1 Tax=Sulfurirhabdus autotrophica TaxID=1706046 RepID=A0A4R3XY35_9PROT|nr:hypothetical protein [Sulfurirhabdus autotrophica]TCV84715.1 hypothetical protein EDC63_11159 [Sulfurirhabdus autotrophica]